MSERLFAYGTLRPGLTPAPLEGLLAPLVWCGSARVPGYLYDLGAYPGAILDPDAQTYIHGELAEAPEDPGWWAALDRYEGADPGAAGGGLFRRVRCAARRPGGARVEAWIYVYAREPGLAPRIVGGHYAGGAARGRLARSGRSA